MQIASYLCDILAAMPPRSAQPLLDRLCAMRCRLTYAQQRIRELEALLDAHGVEIPNDTTQVPPITHQCR